MISFKEHILKKTPVNIILYAAMLLMAGLLVMTVSSQSNQAVMSIPAHIHFDGVYRQNGGEWQTLDAEADLSAYRGDITFRGSFDTELWEGIEMRFYLNHIGMEIYRDGEMLYGSSQERYMGMCGSTWVSWELPAASLEDVFEIRLFNPHRFGNRNAYQQFLDSIYMGSDVIVENYFDRQSQPYRAVGIFILVGSIALTGTAVGYRLLCLPNSSLLLKAGIMSLMMGTYIHLDAKDISFWSGQMAFNTCVRRLAIMAAAWLLGASVTELLHGKRRRMAETAVYMLAGTDLVLMAVSIAGAMEFYDTGIYWAAVQGAVSLFLLILTVLETKHSTKRRRLMQYSAIVLLTVLLLELANASMGWWRSGICMKIVFTVLFVFHLVRAAWVAAKNQQDSLRAEKLREELKNSRIVLAMSQIRTHFVFNILNAISGMCEYNPQKADETLVMFSRYLRRNISIMEKDELEDFAESLEHLEEYVHLEQIRFGERIRLVKTVEVENFKIPPLVLQPLVENAIRHGLLHKKQGGTVSLHTWAEEGGSVIVISDDGVGFDAAAAPGEESVGMKNVRFRLKYMVGGTMDVESVPGQGTTVTIRIPGKQKIQKAE